MYVTKQLAAQIESCFKQSHIEFIRHIPSGTLFNINGGAACFSGFDSYFSQVIGWGFYSKKKQFVDEIQQIEAFYKSLNHHRVDIELSPYVHTELVGFLSHRGYRVSELTNVAIYDLTSYTNRLLDNVLIIREVELAEIKYWAKQVAAGFGFPQAEEQFYHYAQACGVKAFAVFEQDRIVAGATVAAHGRICDLGVTSTLPAYRGQGLQKGLLHARLGWAKEAGLDLATVSTAPGSVSELNCQKVGFRNAYTRIKLTLDCL